MKNKHILILLLLNSCSCEPDSQLNKIDGQPCVELPDGSIEKFSVIDVEFETYNIGECYTGTIKNLKNDEEVCIGSNLGKSEECNGLDDDCDGDIDEGYSLNLRVAQDGNDCFYTQQGVCKISEKRCIDGTYQCIPTFAYGTEECDGLDNDCDGYVDEDTLEEPLFPGERYVYDGPVETLNIGECRAGYKECINGDVYLRNMRTPIQEICGNDDDDDCDGFIDEIENGVNTNDYLFVIDYSGSMSSIINSVATALCDWSSQGSLVGSRFAVVAIGYCNGNTYCDNQMKLLTDFTDAQTACEIIRDNNALQNSGGLEYQINAVLDSNTQSTPLTVTWGNNNKKIIIFSDESMQFYAFPQVVDAVNAVIEQCTLLDYSVSAFINYNSTPHLMWLDMTQQCNGFLDYLNPNPNAMIQSLNYWIGEQC